MPYLSREVRGLRIENFTLRYSLAYLQKIENCQGFLSVFGLISISQYSAIFLVAF
jgi:hypothetical protein